LETPQLIGQAMFTVVQAASGESRSQFVVLGIVERDELGRLGDVTGVEERAAKPVSRSALERWSCPLAERVAVRLPAEAKLPCCFNEVGEEVVSFVWLEPVEAAAFDDLRGKPFDVIHVVQRPRSA
jgi:hypothetical protein